MKKFFTLSLLLFFTLALTPSLSTIAQIDNEEDEFTASITDEDFQDEDLPDLNTITEDLGFIIDDLSAELEDMPNKSLRLVVNKIKRVSKLLESALNSSDEGDVDLCDENLSDAEKLLDKAISQFDKRTCQGEKITKSCIPSDITDLYLPDLEDVLNELDDAISLDDDEDDIPDVCGFAE